MISAQFVTAICPVSTIARYERIYVPIKSTAANSNKKPHRFKKFSFPNAIDFFTTPFKVSFSAIFTNGIPIEKINRTNPGIINRRKPTVVIMEIGMLMM